MFRKFLATKLFKVILIAAACGLLIFLNPANVFHPLQLAVKEIFSPFQKISYLASLKLLGAKEFLSSIGQLKRENERLTEENQKLLARNAMFRDVERENKLLKEQMNLAPGDKFKLETAYVISRDPRGLGNWIEISKGRSDGIREGMPVIVSQGILIGVADEVRAGSSRVTLITNPQSVVNAMIAETGTKGVVRGEYGLGIIFDMVLQTDPIKAGDEIVTSGIGKNIPRGLLIGKVQDVRLSGDRLFQQAAISSPVQFSRTEIVFVIKNVK
ncbi:MAG: rod shape-determining protein MreC [Candidatus Moranbacteria bacterium]|nr:rod shape-determining protein MreC [Candidatus Moranbacteria bacterium]